LALLDSGVHSWHGLLLIVYLAKFDIFRLNGFIEKWGCSKNLDNGCGMALWVCNL